MKHKFLFTALIVACIGISSCKKEAAQAPNNVTSASDKTLKCGHITPPPCTPPSTPPSADCGTPQVVNLKTSSHTTVGTVTVSNSATSLHVTYTATGSYRFDQLNLYVGTNGGVPVHYGSVNANAFPNSHDFNNGGTTYTFTIPLANLGSCFSVFAEAELRSSSYGGCYGGNNTTVAWADGTHFTGNGCGSSSNATYFTYCKASCNTPVDTCLTPVSILFGGEAGWPYGQSSVTVGGFTYTYQQAMSAYIGPADDSRTALSVVATLKLYTGHITLPSTVSSAVTTTEAWLQTLGKLDGSATYTAPANVQSAIGVIQVFINSNLCSSSN